MSLTLEVKGLDKLLKKYGPGAADIVKAVTRGTAEDMREKIAQYPGPVKYPIQWSSPRQRGAYLGMRKRAGLPAKYRRLSDPMSQRLGPSWATEQRGLSAVVGTRVTYAPLVQEDGKQWSQHKRTGWKTDKQVIEEAKRERIPERNFEEAMTRFERRL